LWKVNLAFLTVPYFCKQEDRVWGWLTYKIQLPNYGLNENVSAAASKDKDKTPQKSLWKVKYWSQHSSPLLSESLNQNLESLRSIGQPWDSQPVLPWVSRSHLRVSTCWDGLDHLRVSRLARTSETLKILV